MTPFPVNIEKSFLITQVALLFLCVSFIITLSIYSFKSSNRCLFKQFYFIFVPFDDLTSFYEVISLVEFTLVHVILSFYHTIFFHMGNHTDSCQTGTIFSIILTCYEKFNYCQRFMPNLCYIIYIVFMYWGFFSLQTTFNDPHLISYFMSNLDQK